MWACQSKVSVSCKIKHILVFVTPYPRMILNIWYIATYKIELYTTCDPLNNYILNILKYFCNICQRPKRGWRATCWEPLSWRRCTQPGCPEKKFSRVPPNLRIEKHCSIVKKIAHTTLFCKVLLITCKTNKQTSILLIL